MSDCSEWVDNLSQHVIDFCLFWGTEKPIKASRSTPSLHWQKSSQKCFRCFSDVCLSFVVFQYPVQIYDKTVWKHNFLTKHARLLREKTQLFCQYSTFTWWRKNFGANNFFSTKIFQYLTSKNRFITLHDSPFTSIFTSTSRWNPTETLTNNSHPSHAIWKMQKMFCLVNQLY